MRSSRGFFIKKVRYNMFKNCVFKADVNTTQWVKAAVRRAVKTMAQTFVATIGTAAAMGEVNWPESRGLGDVYKRQASATVLAGILSLGTSVAGLPEVETKTRA